MGFLVEGKMVSVKEIVQWGMMEVVEEIKEMGNCFVYGGEKCKRGRKGGRFGGKSSEESSEDSSEESHEGGRGGGRGGRGAQEEDLPRNLTVAEEDMVATMEK